LTENLDSHSRNLSVLTAWEDGLCKVKVSDTDCATCSICSYGADDFFNTSSTIGPYRNKYTRLSADCSNIPGGRHVTCESAFILYPLFIGNPTAAAAPTTAPTAVSPFTCYGVNSTATYEQLVVSYNYSLETVPTADRFDVSIASEIALEELLAPLLLSCRNTDNAKMASARIVAIVPSPRDLLGSSDISCVPSMDPANVCTVWHGWMRFYRTPGSDINDDVVRSMILSTIQQTMNGQDLVKHVDSLVKTTYTGPTLPDGCRRVMPNTQLSGPQPDSASKKLSLIKTSLLCVASVAVVVAVLGMAALVRMRDRRNVNVSIIEDVAMNDETHSTAMANSDASARRTISPNASNDTDGAVVSLNENDPNLMQEAEEWFASNSYLDECKNDYTAEAC
jgi:hypothetical protein